MSNKNQRSDVWDFFLRSEHVNIADCKICEKQVKTGGGTTNLRNHLRSKHPSYLTLTCLTTSNIKTPNSPEEDIALQSTSSNIYSPQASTSALRKTARLKNEESNGSIPFSEANDKLLNSNNIKTRKRQSAVISPVGETIIKNNCVENEFDYFCKSIAIQLKNMPLDRALICQEKLQRVMTAERMHQCTGSSSPGNSSFAESSNALGKPSFDGSA